MSAEFEVLQKAWFEVLSGQRVRFHTDRAIQIHVAYEDGVNGYGWHLNFSIILVEPRELCYVCQEPLNRKLRCPRHLPDQAWTPVLSASGRTLEAASTAALAKLQQRAAS